MEVRQLSDLLGVGFGPGGIALAAMAADWREANPETENHVIEFFESRGDSSWHPGQLLPGTTLQHHFFRDFATPRNPRSQFTFSKFLWEKGRIFDFGLADGPVLRSEWNEYIIWASIMLADYVTYNAQVTKIEPCIEDGRVTCLLVTTTSGQRYTRSLVLSTGHPAYIPTEFHPFLNDHFFHSSSFLQKVKKIDHEKTLSFCVVGSGQSAAEILVYIHDHFPRAVVHSTHRKTAFKLLDHGQFGHKIYSPTETDYFYNLPPEWKGEELREVFQTNYSGVDSPTSSTLYKKYYENKVLGNERIFIHDRRHIQTIEEKQGKYRIALVDSYTKDVYDIQADIVIICTGFFEEKFPCLLQSLKSYILTDQVGNPLITRDYRVQTTSDFGPLIYLNGLCERTHGMSDANSFSMMAIKAQTIYNSWRDRSSNGR